MRNLLENKYHAEVSTEISSNNKNIKYWGISAQGKNCKAVARERHWKHGRS
jgi:hypothetical protein